MSRYPNAQEGLEALIRIRATLPNWSGPYFRKDNIRIRGATTIEYTVPRPNNTPFELKSLGADGKRAARMKTPTSSRADLLLV